MNPAEAPASLDQLRGLHLPAVVGGPVSGEVLLALLLGFGAALVVGLVRAGMARRQSSIRRAALIELAASRDLEGSERILAQARLLRRLLRTLAGDEAAAAQGHAFAQRLDTLLRTDIFSSGPGRILVDGLYRRTDPDPARLDAELARLIGKLRA